MAHAQAEERASERARAARVDGGHELLRHRLAQADGLALLVHAPHVQKRQLHRIQRIVVGHVSEAPALHQARHDLLAHAVDVHRSAARPMQKPLERLRRTVDGDAAEVRLALFADDGAAAARTRRGHMPRLRALRPQRQHGPQHLGDDVARLAHDNGVAHAHVLALHLVLVVQRRARHRGARHHHRLHLGHGRELARAAHLHGDVAQKRGLLLRRELERDGPARRARRVAHRLLLGERVHLHHHAVDLVRQRLAPLYGARAERVDGLARLAALHVGVHVEARLTQPLQKLPLALRRERALVGCRVQKRGQVALRGDGRVLLPQAARSGVARVGERLLAIGLGCGVQRVEAALGHVHLAAQLDGRVRGANVGRAAPSPGSDLGQTFRAQTQRHVLHRAHVRRHVLARGAVAARGGPHEAPALVGERDGRPVDLQLAHHGHHAPERLRHAVEPRVQLFQVHGVVERVHALRVAHGGELLAHVAAHALRGAVRVVELGMRRLQLAQLAHERVERAVGDLGRVLGVVQVAVVLDLAAQLLDARARIARRLGERALVQKRLLFVGHVPHHRFVFLPRNSITLGKPDGAAHAFRIPSARLRKPRRQG